MFGIILFVAGLLLAPAGILAAFFGKSETAYSRLERARGNRDAPAEVQRMPWVAGGIAAAFLGLLLALLQVVSVVSTQDIGIPTEFGKPRPGLANGIHWKLPWEVVHPIDAKVQTTTFKGTFDSKTQSCEGAIPVRIAKQQTACMNVSIQWRINPQAAGQLYKTFGDLPSIQENLVVRKLEVVLNQAFDNFDPIASLTSNFKEGTPQNPTAAMYASQVAAAMRSQIGSLIIVRDVLITTPSYDPSVQSRINGVLSQTAQTDIAIQAEKTAAAQAAANRILAKSVSNDPGVLVSRCEDIVIEAMKAGYQLPQTWNCNFGSGSGTSIIVSPKK